MPAHIARCVVGEQCTKAGFSLLEGLRRHVTGWGSDCDVICAARRLARDYFNRQFSAAEEQERQEKLRLEENEESPNSSI